MLIARFGADTWAGSYEFPTLKAVDGWQTTRPPVTQRVSGASGEFDFYGDDNFPVAPFDVTKTFALEGSSYANVETILNTLRDTTIALGRARLWGLWRDGTTRVWTWAKCTGMKAVETRQQKTSVLMDVVATFRASSGFWYGETKNLGGITCEIDQESNSSSITNNGNSPALVKFTVTPDTVTMTSAAANVATQCTWQFDDSVLATKDLVVDGELYVCTNDGADAYEDLTVGESALIGSVDTPQNPFFWLEPGANLVVVKRAPFPAAGEVVFLIDWWDTYVL